MVCVKDNSLTWYTYILSNNRNQHK